MKHITSRLFLVLIALTTFTWGAATGKISGRIVDAESGDPLIGVNVILPELGIGAATDTEGYFTIINVRPGTYQVTASMIGYTTTSVENVKVIMGLTTPLDINMPVEVLGMETITVVSERPIVQKDLSGSQLNVGQETIEQWPISSVSSVLGVQAGVENMQVRGGGSYQTAVILDGFMLNDSRSNAPVTTISLSSVEEIQVQSGGFNAEYGNIRSGIVNVVTAEGSPDKYSGSFYYQHSPATPKNFGISPYDVNSYFMRPYLDDDVAWTGTSNGAWDDYTQAQYPNFAGWNERNDPETGMTATAAQQQWIYEHRRTGAITKPDKTLDLGFGGPVPLLSDLRFYLSHRSEEEMFIFPLSRDGYSANSTRMKFNYNPTRNIKIVSSYQYNEEHSVNQYNWTTVPEGNLLRGTYSVANLASEGVLFTPGYFSPYSIFRNRYNVSLNHMLSSSSFYEVIVQYGHTRYRTYELPARDTSMIEIFPGFFDDEAPYGYDAAAWMNLGRDTSRTSSFLVKFDYTNQLNKYNQVKAGIQFTQSDFKVRSYTESDKDTWTRAMNYDVSPSRISAYVQDKLEFEGFIANLGLRGEYADSNTDIYILDDFDDLFKQGLGYSLEEEAEKEAAKPTLTLSPRLGISHPITDHSKLYFNYGHFYSEAQSTYRFRLQRESNGLVTNLGNAELDQERTIAYELGYSHGFMNTYLLDIAAYYKDITNQPGWVIYRNANGSVNYRKAESNNYQDIRGIELTLSKPAGRYISGFINYTYMVSTSGYFGLLRHYQNSQDQRDYEKLNVRDSKPRPRPYLRANIALTTPPSFGYLKDFKVSLLGQYKTGSQFNLSSLLFIDEYVQWTPRWTADLRLQKTFRAGKMSLETFCDITNVFNLKYLSYSGFSDRFDYIDYLQSLRFPFEEGEQKGDDYVGTYRNYDVAYDPLEENPDNDPEITRRNEERIETRSYIDMPNYQSLTFLNPRNFTFGIRFKF